MAGNEVNTNDAGKLAAQSPRREAVLFYALIVVLTAVALWPIWATRLLPMQDYPQHLFLARITANYHQLSWNWKDFYRVDLGLRPYMLWYLAANLLARGFEIEVAGKLLFSLYILLITLLVLVARRLTPGGYLPWGALLLYPFAFNQMYFMGFSNYIISLPILLLAVLDLDHFAGGFSSGNIARHAVYFILLFLSHPYSVLVYIALALTSTLFPGRSRPESLRMLIPPVAMGLIFAAWYLMRHGPSSAPTSLPWAMTWWPLDGPLAFYLLQFTGMRWTGGPDWLTAALWGLVALPFVLPWLRRDKADPVWRRLAALNIAALLGFIALPFWMGYYAYFNLRLAPVSYFALSLLLCRLRVPFRSGMLLGCAVMALLFGSIQVQKSVAREAETILPVLQAARGNALVLPLIFGAGSDVLDSVFFYQIHSHETDYYHAVVGGGASPALFPNAMMPVQYRPGLRLPYPDTPWLFSWPEHGAYYDYVLVRQAPADFYRYLAPASNLVARSGHWSLFENRMPRKSL